MKKGVPYCFLSSPYFLATSETCFIFPLLSLLFACADGFRQSWVNHVKVSVLMRRTRNFWPVGKSGVLHTTFPFSDQVSLSLSL